MQSIDFDDEGYVVFPAGTKAGFICGLVDKADYTLDFKLACVQGDRLVTATFTPDTPGRVLS